MIAAVTVVVTVVAGALPAAGASSTVRAYRPAGTRTSGGANPVDAPTLAPGAYLDTFARAGANSVDGTAKYFRVRLHKGDTPYFTATEVPAGRAAKDDAALSVELTLAPVDRSVSGCQTSASGSSDSYGAGLDTATAVLSPGRVGGPDWDDCPTDALYALHVTRSGSAFTGRPLDIEIAYRAEPAGTDSGPTTPVVASAAKNIRAAVSGPVTTVAGGTGYDDAPLLPTGRYRDSFTSGERRYYRVHLDWGQRLAWTFTADQLPNVKDYDGAEGAVVLRTPIRDDAAQPSDAEATGSDLGATTGAVFGSTLVPVRYANRTSTDSDVTPYSIAGDYYLIVSTDYPDDGKATLTVPYRLDVQVVGAPSGGPSYAVDGTAVAKTSSARSVGTSVWASSIVGAVVVVAVAAGLLLWRRRQRRTHT